MPRSSPRATTTLETIPNCTCTRHPAPGSPPRLTTLHPPPNMIANTATRYARGQDYLERKDIIGSGKLSVRVATNTHQLISHPPRSRGLHPLCGIRHDPPFRTPVVEDGHAGNHGPGGSSATRVDAGAIRHRPTDKYAIECDDLLVTCSERAPVPYTSPASFSCIVTRYAWIHGDLEKLHGPSQAPQARMPSGGKRTDELCACVRQRELDAGTPRCVTSNWSPKTHTPGKREAKKSLPPCHPPPSHSPAHLDAQPPVTLSDQRPLPQGHRTPRAGPQARHCPRTRRLDVLGQRAVG